MVVKTLEEAKKHLDEAAAFIPARYEEGVKKGTWKDAAIKGEEAFKATMSAVIAEERRKKGVSASSDDAWRNGAVEKGRPIIGTRIKGSLDKYEKNFGFVYKKVTDEIPKLKARTIDPMANIDSRLKPLVEVMIKAKKERRGY